METRRGGGQGIQGGQGDRGTGEWGDRGKGTREIEGLGRQGVNAASVRVLGFLVSRVSKVSRT